MKNTPSSGVARAVVAATSVTELLNGSSSSKKQKKAYPGTQQNLYTCARLGWGYCLEHLPMFTAASPRFTTEWVAAAVENLDKAEILPDQASRTSGHTTARKALQKENKRITGLWQFLKDYILAAYPKDVQEDMLRAAGTNYYERAMGKSWENTASLINSATNFMVAELKVLTENNVMPTTFPDEFKTAADAFAVSRSEFLNKVKAAEKVGSNKFNANEQVYAGLTDMCNLGKRIFQDKPLERKLFTVADLLGEARGNHPAGWKGKIVSKPTGHGIETAVVLALNKEGYEVKSVETNAMGKYELTLPSGEYTVRVTAPDFVPVVIKNKPVLPGTMSRLNVLMELAPVAEPAVESLLPENGAATEPQGRSTSPPAAKEPALVLEKAGSANGVSI